MIKNIVFDFGGVLMDWDPRYFFRDYFKDDEKMEYFLANICNGVWNAEQDRGRTFAKGVQILQAEHPEFAKEIQLYDENWETMIKGEFPRTVELLHRLKEAGYALYGLTNWSAEKFPYVLHKYEFFSLFEGIVVSGEEKCIKPDLEIYRILLSRYSLRPEETVFIDDNQINLDTARNLGIKTVLFDSYENAAARLESILGRRGLK